MYDSIASGRLGSTGGIVRGPLAWHFYLLIGFFQYIVAIQGNVLPFLQSELALSYRVVGLHPSAIAVGAIFVGIFGDAAIRRFGRRRMLIVGTSGFIAAILLLSAAPAAAVSVAACFLLGLFGAFVPTVVFATLAEVFGDKRSVVFNEATAMAYAFAIAGPLLTGLAVSISLNWRSALLAGAAVGAGVLISFMRSVSMPEPAGGAKVLAARLPPAYWAYWAALAFSVATEFSILIWAPAFLERVLGLAPALAATAAVAFAVAMLAGRVAGSGLVRVVPVPQLFLGTLVVALAGFVLYWGAPTIPALAVAGLFVLGLGIAQTYPLTFGQAMGAAGALADRGSARTAIAAGLALATMPAALGFLADSIGLRNAHLIIAVLIVAALVAFTVARRLEGRALFA